MEGMAATAVVGKTALPALAGETPLGIRRGVTGDAAETEAEEATPETEVTLGPAAR